MTPATLRVLVTTLFVILAQPISAGAQTNSSAPLSPAAQEALNKGVIAAKAPDYLLAIRFFEAARKFAPQAPVIFLNLGLAESRIPGRELRAMAWFGAYLAAVPEASNAAAVKEQIAELDVKNQINLSRLLVSVQTAAALLSGTSSAQSFGLWAASGLWLKTGDIASAQKAADLIRHADSRTGALVAIAEAKFGAGDIAGARNAFVAAQRSADLIDREPSFGIVSAAGRQSERQATIVEGQTSIGDIAGAQRTADLIKPAHAHNKSRALTNIARARMKAGDVAGAQKTLADAQKSADLIVDWPYGKRIALSSIADAQIATGDMSGAQKTLGVALKTADLIDSADSKSMAQSSIAEAQVRSADIAGALKTLALAQETADRIKDASYKSIARTQIAEAQAKAGDMAGADKSMALAQNFADLIPGESYGKSWAQSALAEAQASRGKLADAQKNADLVQDANLKNRAQGAIDKAQAKANAANTRQSTTVGPVAAIVKSSDWLKKLDDSDDLSEGALNTAPFLDLAAYLKSLPPSGDPKEVFDSLGVVAGKIVKAQNIISGMLKSDAKR